MARFKDSIVTTSSADGRTVGIARDADGNGTVDQTETDVTAIDSSEVKTITDLGPSGHVLDTPSSPPARWPGHHDAVDLDGNGTIDRTRADVTVSNLDGSSTETMTDRNSDGTLHERQVRTTSGDGLTVTLQRDTLGAGYTDYARSRPRSSTAARRR